MQALQQLHEQVLNQVVREALVGVYESVEVAVGRELQGHETDGVPAADHAAVCFVTAAARA